MPDQDLENTITEMILLQNMGTDSEEKGMSDPVAAIEPADVDERLVVFHRPRSIESEYFRFVKHRIEQQMEAKETGKGKVILVTGPNLGVGKSTCSINLAMVFARSYGNKILFLDADTRRGTSRRYLGIKEDDFPGFVDVVTMKQKAEEVLLNTGLFDMDYFPSGQFNDAFIDDIRGNELLNLINSLREKYSYVIIDAPPAFPMPETAIIAQHCDGVFIVLRAGRDGREDLEQAKEALEGAYIMGVILNAVKTTPGQRYGSYGYYGKR